MDKSLEDIAVNYRDRLDNLENKPKRICGNCRNWHLLVNINGKDYKDYCSKHSKGGLIKGCSSGCTCIWHEFNKDII